MSAPTITVKLDNGTGGTFPTDITTKVRLPDGVTVSGYGRTDEFTQTQPSTLTLTLDNADGHFTDGTITLVPNTTLIRYTETSGATTVNQFTGRVVTLGLGWPGGGQEFATVQVTASDYLPDLSRRILRSMLEQEILLDSPTAYYTLGDPAGSPLALDSSGTSQTSLSIAGTSPALTFGSGTGPVDGLTSVTFGGGVAGQYLSRADTMIPSSGPWTLEFFYGGASATGSGATLAYIANPDGTPYGNLLFSGVGILGGNVGGVGFADSVVTTDGLTHHGAFTFDGVNTGTLYVDGVPKVSHSTLVLPVAGLGQTNIGGGNPGVAGIAGTMSHVAVYSTALSAARIASHSRALTAFVETTDARLSRLASYAGMTATTTSPSGQIMGTQATSGQSLFDAMQQVALAEGGVFYADGTGALQMQGRYYRSKRTTADLTITSDAVDPGTDVTWDTQQLVNQVTVTRTGGEAQVTGSPTGAAFPQSLELDVDTDANALSAAQWIVARHSTTTPRLASVTIDLMAPPTGTTAASIIALDLGKRISITPMPSQMWSGTTDFTIEGWSRTVTESSWTVTYNLLPWSLFQVWILDDPVYSVLGTTTILGY